MNPVVRPTVVLVENSEILLVKQNSDGLGGRRWSLPGGRLEGGESLESCAIREIKEETGLDVSIDSLLFVCDRIGPDHHIVHTTFSATRVGGSMEIGPGPDAEQIEDVRMVPLESLCEYGFSSKFRDLAMAGFPGKGTYQGSTDNIGL